MGLVDLPSLGGPCIDAWGQPVTYSPATGLPFTINGVFDEAYREVDPSGSGIGLTSASPMLGVNLSDLPNPPLQDDQLTIQSSGSIYIVKEVRVDSHGWAQLMLNKVSA
jgi:hypothetical protein